MGKIIEGEAQEKRLQDIEKLKLNLETNMGQVYKILEEYPDSRGNDGILLCYWMKIFKGVDSFQEIMALAKKNELSFETVRRNRQRIQHAGKFLPGDDTVSKRRNLQETWRSIQAGDLKVGEELI